MTRPIAPLRLFVPLASLLSLAACGLTNPDAEFPDPGCRAAMYEDADVRRTLSVQGQADGGPGAYRRVIEAKQAAYARCAQSITGGGQPPGGVEKVKKGWW